MSLRAKSYFQGLTTAVKQDWIDTFDSVPMLKSEDADGATAVGAYIDTSGAWSNAGAKLFSFRNNGTEKAYLTAAGALVLGNKLAQFEQSLPALIVNSSGYLGWTANADATAGIETYLTRYGAGKVVLTGTTPMVAFGGVTSSYPALKRSSAALHVRLADDSAYASLQAASVTVNGQLYANPGYIQQVVSQVGFFCDTNGTFQFYQAELRAGPGGSFGWGTLAIAANDYTTHFARAADGIIFFGATLGNPGCFEMGEITAPAAPAANGVRIYAVDNGGGKTQLMALFSSGAAQQIAIQP